MLMITKFCTICIVFAEAVTSNGGYNFDLGCPRWYGEIEVAVVC